MPRSSWMLRHATVAQGCPKHGCQTTQVLACSNVAPVSKPSYPTRSGWCFCGAAGQSRSLWKERRWHGLLQPPLLCCCGTDACPGLPILSRAREGPSPTKTHDASLETQTSAAWLMSLTNRALAAHKQLQSSAQILPWQSNTSCWGQAGLDITALPSVLLGSPGQPWPSTSCFPESRSWEQLDLFPPRVQQSCGSMF